MVLKVWANQVVVKLKKLHTSKFQLFSATLFETATAHFLTSTFKPLDHTQEYSYHIWLK